MSSILQDKEVKNGKSPATSKEKTGLEGSDICIHRGQRSTDGANSCYREAMQIQIGM